MNFLENKSVGTEVLGQNMYYWFKEPNNTVDKTSCSMPKSLSSDYIFIYLTLSLNVSKYSCKIKTIHVNIIKS